MKEFIQLMRRFVSPYKKYIGWAILLNILSAVFNVFSFTILIPILNILFKTGANDQVYHFMEWGSGSLKSLSGLYDPAQDVLLLRLVGRDDTPAHGRGTRHPCDGLLQGDAPAAGLLLRRA